MFAVVMTGGKQYKVAVGGTIQVEKIEEEMGTEIALERVLMIADGDNVRVGHPLLEGAKVLATVVEQDRAKKIIVYKYKAKARYRRKAGHRQSYTRLTINSIVG